MLYVCYKVMTWNQPAQRNEMYSSHLSETFTKCNILNIMSLFSLSIINRQEPAICFLSTVSISSTLYILSPWIFPQYWVGFWIISFGVFSLAAFEATCRGRIIGFATVDKHQNSHRNVSLKSCKNYTQLTVPTWLEGHASQKTTWNDKRQV